MHVDDLAGVERAGCVGPGEAGALDAAVASSVADRERRMSELDRRETNGAGCSEAELAGIRDPIGVGVGPDPQLRESRIRRVDTPIRVCVELGEGVEVGPQTRVQPVWRVRLVVAAPP